MINEFAYSDVQRYRYSNEQKDVFWRFRSNVSFGGNGICKNLLVLSKVLKNSRELSDKELNWFWRYSLHLGGNNAALFLNRKSGTISMKGRFVGASVNTHYSMLGLGDVKSVAVRITIYVSFVEKLFWYFFVNWIEFAQSGKLLFERHQLLLVSKTCKIEFIGRVAIKTIQIL